jgi:hypothetical protein
MLQLKMAKPPDLIGAQLAKFTVPGMDRRCADLILSSGLVDGGPARFTQNFRYLAVRMRDEPRHIKERLLFPSDSIPSLTLGHRLRVWCTVSMTGIIESLANRGIRFTDRPRYGARAD